MSSSLYPILPFIIFFYGLYFDFSLLLCHLLFCFLYSCFYIFKIGGSEMWKKVSRNSYFCYKYLKHCFCGRIVAVSGRGDSRVWNSRWVRKNVLGTCDKQNFLVIAHQTFHKTFHYEISIAITVKLFKKEQP
jgi:hypothetical protein